MSQKHTTQSRFQLFLALALTSLIGYYLIQVVLEQNYSDRELYHGAEYRFENVSGIRSSDFIIKRPSQQFLIAPSAPKELKAQIELSSAGRYLAVVEAEYPHWLCRPINTNKATVLIRGGSLNQSVKLIQNKAQEVSFEAAKGQRLSLQVSNPKEKGCGRALLTLYKTTEPTNLKIGLITLWACILALCLFSRSSVYIVTIGLLANTLLIAAQASLGALTTANILVNIGLALGFTGLLFFLTAIPLKSRLIALLSTVIVTLLLSPALSFIAYERVFSAPFSIEAVHGAMQSYGAQALEFWREFVGKKRTLYFGFALFVLYLGLRQLNQARTIIPKALVFGISLILAGGALTAGRLENSGIYNLLLKSVIVYRWEIDAFEKVASQRKSFTAQAARSPEHSQDTTVVVFGESVNKKQMSAYGYVRPTTPLLDKRISDNEVVLFTNAYSNHTHSNPTMSMMLTQADQYHDIPWQESPSIFNYAKAANVETQWLTNHRLLGGWSNNITTIIREADRLKTINFKIGRGLKSTNYDPDLVPLFKEAIKERPNQLTYLHLYNSHSFYCNRYPKDFKRFEKYATPVEYGRLIDLKRVSARMLNCYDNTIYYADKVLEQLISELDKRKNPSVLMYVADHAEEVIDARTHNSAVFTFDMINIPLFVWANQAWRDKHAQIWNTLKQNSQKVVTNDFMFESALGLAGIKAPPIDQKNDISSANYTEPSEPLTLHSRAKINHPNNWNYWQQQNIRTVQERELDLLAINIESLGEARVALSMGINNLQLNVRASENDELVITANNGQKTIAPLQEFVAAFKESAFNSANSKITLRLNTNNQKLSEYIAKLEKKTSLNIIKAPISKIKAISLASPNFVQALNRLNLGNSTTSTLIPVTLSSRYTNPPPTPKEEKE